MADADTQAFTVATDDVIASVVRMARGRLVLVAPAVSGTVADAVIDQLSALPPLSAALVFDSDPEVFRLGYGEFEAVERIQQAAALVGVEVRRQPGIRIGVVIADQETLVFTPTPRLIEAGPNTTGGANAIRLGTPPAAVEADLAPGRDGEPLVGRSALSNNDLAATKDALDKNPPLKFDLARKIRVFNAFIEFVELEVRGTELARRTVTLPPHLLAVADKKTREQLETRFRLVPPDDKLSGDIVDKDRKLLARQFLHTIPKFGTVVLQREKEEFLKAVDELRATVERFSAAVAVKLQERIDKSIFELTGALLPALTKRPPSDWVPSSGIKPSKDAVAKYLERDLRDAFGTAGTMVRAMEVRCMVKGVTYNMLTDPDFLEAATKVLPELGEFHKEFEAAEAKSTQQDLFDFVR